MAEARVLVVDDEQSMRELLGIMLRQVGYDVTQADGGEAAIQTLKSADAFDLVITDLRIERLPSPTLEPCAGPRRRFARNCRDGP